LPSFSFFLGKLLSDRFRFFFPIQALGLEWIILLGTCFLAWLLAWISLAFKIGLAIQMIVSGLATLYFLFHCRAFVAIVREYFRAFSCPFIAGALLVVFGCLTLLHAAQPPSFADSGLYHVQFVKWIQNYAVIPGLGNLHGRFAFNSHLHLLSAFFNPLGFGSVAFQQNFSGFLFLLFAAFHIRMIDRGLQQGDAAVIFYAGALVLAFAGYRPYISSPMPDSSVTLLLLMALSLILEKVKGRTLGHIDAPWLLLGVLFFTALTFKISAIYLGLALFYLVGALDAGHRFRCIKILVALGGTICFPWLIRNVMLSGYLYYPLPMPNLLGLDWVIPAAKVKWELWEIMYFSRWPDADWRKIIHADLGTWFPFWFARQATADKILWVSVMLLSVSQLVLWFNKFKDGQREPAYNHLALLFALASVAWFFSAPAFRFGYAYLIGAAVLAVLAWLKPQVPTRFLYPVVGVCLVYAGNGVKNEWNKLGPQQLVWPGAYPTPGLTTRKVGPLVVQVPFTERCWNAPLPCVMALEPGLELRGKSLEEGFRIDQQGPGCH
jgi:hypothetical protein